MDKLTQKIREHVTRLCAGGDRHPGSIRNQDASAYIAATMRDLGLAVESLRFDVPEWCHGGASLRVGGAVLGMHPGPFSPPVHAGGPLIVVTHPAQLEGLNATGAVVLLRGEIARVQFTPRGYPFYSNEEHAAILDLLEASGALALLAATDKDPSMTAGLSPFPLIEEPGFALPTAYLHAEVGAELATRQGEHASVTIDSSTRPSEGTQPIGSRPSAGAKRIVVGAHMDTKPDTPGALDNACGVAVMLAAAELLGDRSLQYGLEFGPFNGEDHVLAPGELAYLAARDPSETAFMVNIDGVGLPGSPSACSLYNADERIAQVVEDLVSGSRGVALGEPWPAGDHMIFAMRGIPAVALTSQDSATVAGTYAHTELDTVDVPDFELLAETARFVSDLVLALDGQ